MVILTMKVFEKKKSLFLFLAKFKDLLCIRLPFKGHDTAERERFYLLQEFPDKRKA